MRLIILFPALLVFVICRGQTKSVSIIPEPVSLKYNEGSLVVKKNCTVSSNFPDHDWQPLLSYFKKEMNERFGITLSEVAKDQAADFVFEMHRMPSSGKPAYRLNVTGRNVVVSSNFAAPAFHAMQTIFQLLESQSLALPALEIYDHARFAYRGMHLDVSRHFFPVVFIKKYIDYLAFYKLNTFHWHLTDDQGWRVEIKKYPELTRTGAWRNGTIIGKYPGTGNDNTRYGGFYTQEEIRNVVKYAGERFIDVVPEIEMPGHGSAAIAAYPWLSCFPGKPTVIPGDNASRKSVEEQKEGRVKLVQESWGVFDDVFCAGNDSTFLFLQNVIDELIPLFPSKYFHIGGDECPKTHWKACPKCQARKNDLGLKDEHELQSWFIQRIEKYLAKTGRTLIGWDEILEGGLAPNAVVMSWRGEKGGIDAARQKHGVIMTPTDPLYFDYSQSENEDSLTIGGYNPIERVYAYNPVPMELSAEEEKFILGAQANLWTEYIHNPKKIEYMLFPRIAALSEILWTQEKSKNWTHFEMRLQKHFSIYKRWNTGYSQAFFDLKSSVIPWKNGIAWKLQSRYTRSNCDYCFIQAEMSILYLNDTILHDTIPKYDKNDITKMTGYEIEKTEKKAGEKGKRRYASPENDTLLIIPIDQTTTARAWQRLHRAAKNVLVQDFKINKATGKKISLVSSPSPKYPGDGAFTLVNGVQNEKGLARNNEFLGFEGKDCELVIDLGEKISFTEVVVNSFSQHSSWIYSPKYAEFMVSNDGVNFNYPKSFIYDRKPDQDRKTRMMTLGEHFFGRFIKIFIKNYGLIPAGKPGAGNPTWLFVDEIEVN